MRIGLFKIVLALSALATGGCATPPHCDALGKCGGDFLAGKANLAGASVASQEWVATAKDACIDEVPNPPQPPSLNLIPARPAGVRPIEPTTIDWCAGLVLKFDDKSSSVVIDRFDDGWYETLKKFGGWFPSVPLYTAQLEVSADSQYTVATSQLAAQHVDLSASCLVQQGFVLSCADLNTELVGFVQAKLGGISNLKAVVYNNRCATTTDGCSCDYDVSLTSTNSGPFGTDSKGHLTFYDAEAAPPSQTDFCVNSAGFQITGSKETDLFNRNSLKTLTLHAPSCSDGVQSQTLGETGIDCGGMCPNACP